MLLKNKGDDLAMWVVQKLYWRSGQQYVQARRVFDSLEEAIQFRENLNIPTELYETNKDVLDKGKF